MHVINTLTTYSSWPNHEALEVFSSSMSKIEGY
jgi:hypothetical protein